MLKLNGNGIYQVIDTIDTLGSIYGKIPKIWQDMSDENGNVNSNYGASMGKRLAARQSCSYVKE